MVKKSAVRCEALEEVIKGSCDSENTSGDGGGREERN